MNYLASVLAQKANGSRPAVAAWPVAKISSKISDAVAANPPASREERCNEALSLIERVHRNFLEVIKRELDGLGVHDINNVQGLMLLNIGDIEMTVGDLRLRGCYLGSNVTYNVKKMVENGYLAQERSVRDRRSIHVRLTDKGSKLRDQLHQMHQRHVEMLDQTSITDEDLVSATATLRRLERFWLRAADLILLPGRAHPGN